MNTATAFLHGFVKYPPEAFVVVLLITLPLSFLVAKRKLFAPIYWIMLAVPCLLAAFFAMGGTAEELRDAYFAGYRQYLADSLMAETISGKTLHQASFISIESWHRPDRIENSYRYSGTFLLFGEPFTFDGTVELICDELKVSCMKSDFSTTKVR